MDAATEAVDLYRELAAGSRDAHLPDLARSLWNIGYVAMLVQDVNDHIIAQTAESLDLYNELAAHEPDAFTALRDAAAKTLADLRKLGTP